MGKAIKMHVTAVFRDIFPDKEKPNITELLIGIPTNSILEIVAHFMVQIHGKEDDFNLQKEIILRWMNQQPIATRDQILSNFDKLITEHGARVSFFNNITSLYFFQLLFSNYNSEEERHLSADEELRLIKAYLITSEIWTEREINYLNQNPSNADEIIACILPFQMIHNEIQSFKDFRSQLIKAIYFFRFIEQDEELKPYLSHFLAQYGLANWKDYIKKIVTPYILSLSGTRSSVLIFDETNKIETDFWDTQCLELKGYDSKPDFLELREFPVFKLKEFNYLFYNYNFIIDKLFQALQFVFSKLLISKGVVATFGDFKSKYYSETFSENYMFYKVMEYCIANQGNITSYNGEELAAKLGEKGPDYYIRVNNNIILIEFKDVLMGANPKVSYNFQKISEEISRKLVKNEGGKAKGVGQLAKFINDFPIGGFDFDKIDHNEIHIFPILIVTDSAFTLFGINSILETEILTLIKSNDSKKVNPLGVMNLDTLLIFQDLFNEKKVNFFDLLYRYNNELAVTNSKYKFQNFSSYFIDYINQFGIHSSHMPKILNEFLETEMFVNEQIS